MAVHGTLSYQIFPYRVERAREVNAAGHTGGMRLPEQIVRNLANSDSNKP
jgi:hypothetical protein